MNQFVIPDFADQKARVYDALTRKRKIYESLVYLYILFFEHLEHA